MTKFAVTLAASALLVLAVSALGDQVVDPAVKRKVDVKYSSNQIKIHAKSHDFDSSKDELFFYFNADTSKFRTVFDFKSKDNSGEIKQEQNRVTAELIRIVEFKSDGGYSGGALESSYPPGDKDGKFSWDWDPISYSQEGFTHEFSVSTKDGVVTVFGTYVEDASAGNTTTGPGQIKLDFSIKGYNYLGSGSKLAFLCGVKSKSKLQTQGIEDGSHYVRTQVDRSAAQGLFSWITTVETDGSTSEILATKGDVDNEGPLIYFTVNDDSQPAEITWDPIIGLEDDPSWWTTGRIVGVILGIVGFLLIAAFCFVQRPCNRSQATVGV